MARILRHHPPPAARYAERSYAETQGPHTYNTGMDAIASAPYAGLTPDTVLDALESVGLRGDGRPLRALARGWDVGRVPRVAPRWIVAQESIEAG